MSSFARARCSWKFLFLACSAGLVAFATIPVASARHPVTPEVTTDERFSLSASEWCLVRKINRIRTRHGRNKLKPDKQVAYVARQHARTIARARTVYHDDNISWKITRWRRLGENTGRGRDCRSITRAFMNSSQHRSQILGRYRFIGVGTERRDGRMYVQQIFESRRDPGNVYNYP